MSDTAEARPKILVVDDSKVMRLSAKKILEEEFELLLEPDGVAAWETLKQHADILALFSDVSMPGLDGYQLLDKIRSSDDARLRDLPVIIVTGNEEESAREDALGHGATDFITKPFDRAQLLARARAHASHDQMRRRSVELEASNTEDSVTGLGNRRYFERRLREGHAHALRHQRPMALIRLDISDFDEVVAKRGKRVAVEMLRELGQQLKASLREEDVISRLAAARFAVICPECDREGAETLADRVHRTIIDTPLAGEHAIKPDVVLGVYLPSMKPKETLDEIYKAVQASVAEATALGAGSIVFRPEREKAQASGLEEQLFARIKQLLDKAPKDAAERVLARLAKLRK